MYLDLWLNIYKHVICWISLLQALMTCCCEVLHTYWWLRWHRQLFMTWNHRMRKEQQRFTRSLAQLGSVLHLVWNTTVIAQCLKLGKSALEGIILKPTMKGSANLPFQSFRGRGPLCIRLLLRTQDIFQSHSLNQLTTRTVDTTLLKYEFRRHNGH